MGRKDKKKYRLASIACILILVLSIVTGCGAGNADDDSSQNKPTSQQQTDGNATKEADTSYDITLGFAGDVNFDENWSTMAYYKEQGENISHCISQNIIDQMTAMDLMWINNEFTYSSRGTPMSGKAYTFRANPDRVQILKQLGVDIVGLANNHVYDYGEAALLDTFTTLEEAHIPYVGAGRNLTQAMSPVYLKADGKTIAYVAASRAEKNRMTPEATESSPGILRCYDNTLFLQEIQEAAANADYVIALPHWGTEYSYELEEAETTGAKAYIDAGADIVIGAHTHFLQGMEYYKGKPIIYSLGNFWFNEKTLDTMLLKVHIYGKDDTSSGTAEQVEVQVIPAVQKNYVTTEATTSDEKNRIYQFLQSISVNAVLDSDGILREQ